MSSIPRDTYAPEMQNRNSGKAVLIVTADKTEDLEFFYPYYRFIEAGYRVDVATPRGGEFKTKHEMGLKDSKRISEVDAADYQMLYIPGGKAPEQLKKTPAAVEIAKAFAQSGKPIAAICHGPQLLAEAGVISGKKIAAWPEVKGELEKAGATYVNEETMVDGQFITARWPADLPAHMKHTLQILQQSMKPRVAA